MEPSSTPRVSVRPVLKGLVVSAAAFWPIAARAWPLLASGLSMRKDHIRQPTFEARVVAVLLEQFRGDSANLEVHHCVVGTTHFCTATDVYTFVNAFNLEPALRLIALGVWESVALEQELRNPEGVDDVSRSEVELDRGVSGDHENRNLIGSADGFDLVEVKVGQICGGLAVDRALGLAMVSGAFFAAGGIVELTGAVDCFLAFLVGTDVVFTIRGELTIDGAVAELPVPLVCGHVDGDLGVLIECGDFILRLDGEEEHAHNDDDRNNRQHQLEANVVSGLAGEFALALLFCALGGTGTTT